MPQYSILDLIADAAEASKAVAAALAPSALGATIAVTMKRGLTWAERLVQIFVGICVSWYARVGIEALTDVDPFFAQSIAFTVGLIAYDALPRFRERTIAFVAEFPDLLRDWASRRKDSK
jgi:hypothetical protein